MGRLKHVTPREGPGNPASAGPADTKARRRRVARQAGPAGASKPAEPLSPPRVLADFQPTPEQLAKARKWLVRTLARRAVELLDAKNRKA